MSDDLPPWLGDETALRALRLHADGRTCVQCRPAPEARCVLLEWGTRTMLATGEKLPAEVRHLVTMAARLIVTHHWPDSTGLCPVCGDPDCAAMGPAAAWLDAIRDPFLPPSVRTVLAARKSAGADG